MKKIAFLLVLVFFVGTIIISCKKDPAILVPPVPVPPVLNITILPSETIVYGGSATINISTNADYVTVNGNRLSVISKFETGTLLQTTSYDVVAINSDGSTKKTIIVNVEKAPLPILTVSFSKDPIVFGGKSSFSWETLGFVTSVTLDGVAINSSGSFNTPVLYQNKEYTLIVTGPGGSKTEKILINVGNWTTSKLGLLTYDGVPWMTKYLRVWQDGKMVADLELDQYQKTNKYYFMLDNHIKLIEESGKSDTSGEWYFSDDEKYLLMGKDKVPSLIEGLTKNEFVFSSPTNYYSKPATFQITYYRPGVQ